MSRLLPIVTGFAGIPAMAGATPISPPQTSYPVIVNSVGTPVAYWRCGDATGLTDASSNNRHGTFDAAAPALVDSLLSASLDQASQFAGQSATVPHDAGLVLSAFTLSLWLRIDQVPELVANVFPIVKDDSGFHAGDWALAISDERRIWTRFQTGAATAPGVISEPQTLGTPIHIAVVGSGAGLALWINGQFVGLDDTYTGGWSVNTTALQFCKPNFSAYYAYCTLDEIALYGAALTQADILALAMQEGGAPPVVPDRGPFEIAESASLEVDLLVDVVYAGSSPTVAIVDKTDLTGGGHDVTESGGVATITTGAVGTDQLGLTFTYTVTDANGTSNVGTVTVNVRDTEIPAAGPIYQCYTESGADTVEVASMAALAAAINAAPAGRNILIAPGTYTGGTYTLTPAGGTDNPVVVRPRDGIGTVTINSASWTLTGSRFVLAALYFNNAALTLDNGASFTRIDRCRFRQIGRAAIHVRAATDTRISRCDASEYISDTATKAFIRLRHTNIGDGTLKRALIDLCHVHDINPAQGVNGSEPVGQSASTGQALFANAEIVVERCLFRNVGPIPDEGELLGLKSGGWKIQFCTFEDCDGMYLNVPRQGFDMEVRSCWFEGGRNPTLQVMSDNPLIIGNRFVGGEHLDIFAGNYTWDEIIAIGNPPGTAYSVVRNGRVIGNVLDTGSIRVGQFWSNLTATKQVSGTVLEANTRNGAPATTGNGVSMVYETGTTVSGTTTEPYVPAVKLAPADVGLGASDAVCGPTIEQLFRSPHPDDAFNIGIGSGASYAAVPELAAHTTGVFNGGDNAFGIWTALNADTDPLRTISGSGENLPITNVRMPNAWPPYETGGEASILVDRMSGMSYSIVGQTRSSDGSVRSATIARPWPIADASHGTTLNYDRRGTSASGIANLKTVVRTLDLFTPGNELEYAIGLVVPRGHTGHASPAVLGRGIKVPAGWADFNAHLSGINTGPLAYGDRLGIPPSYDYVTAIAGMSTAGMTYAATSKEIAVRFFRQQCRYGCIVLDGGSQPNFRIDTRDVLAELGYNDAKVQAIYNDLKLIIRALLWANLKLITNAVTGATAIVSDSGGNQFYSGSIGTLTNPAGGGTALGLGDVP